MIGYQLRLALRTIFKNRLYTFISVFGLAVGMAVSVLILSFVRYELAFDGMHHGSERIYRLNWEITGSRFATFFNGVTPIYDTIFPQIDTFSRLAPSELLLTIDGVNQIGTVSMVDNDFFTLFNYGVVSGDASTAIRDMSSAVITVAAAQQYFGATMPDDAIGKVFTIGGAYDFRIAAIVANNPGNSHLGSNLFINIENLPAVWNSPNFYENLGSDVFYHYVRLNPGTNVIEFQDELANAYSEEINPGFEVRVVLQPMMDIHFTTDLQNEMSMRDDVLGFVKPFRQRSDVLVFSAVALMTLLIAVVNFMNLQLVQFTKRTREVAIKRILGSSRAELVQQFLLETMLIAFLALLAAMAMCVAFMPYFNTMVAASIDSAIIFSPASALLLLLVAGTLGLLAGLYPASTIARLSPATAIRGEVVKGVSSSRFRSALIVTQFAISVGLIVSAGVINSQINFALTSGLGFVPANVVTVELPNAAARNAYVAMRSELQGEPGVLSVAAGDIIPGRDLSNGTGFSQINGVEQGFGVRSVTVGDDYFDALGMEFVAGRALDDDYSTDFLGDFSATNVDRVGGMVLNETAARQAGFTNPADAIGAEIYGAGNFNGTFLTTNATVIGVVRNAQFGSIRAEVPAIGFSMAARRNVMLVKIAAQNQQNSLAAIDRVWNENVIELPIQRNFLTDSYSAFYAGEQRTFILFMVLSVIAIGIACLGLYAVAAYIIERRSKEISIRKVLGATVQNLAALLAWDFSKLVLIANLIAWPIAWWGMQRWLSNFTFQADIGVSIFLLAGLTTLLLALATILQRAYQVANQNPVNSLRTE